MRDPDSSSESKKEAQAGAGGRDPVDSGDNRDGGKQERGLGEGSVPGLSVRQRSGDLADDDAVAAVFVAWDAMEARHALPGPLVPDVPRRIAVVAQIERIGLDGCLTLIAAVEASNLISGARAKRHRGQADWEATFDHVFRVGPRFIGSRLLERLLLVPAQLLAGTPLDDFAALADAELAVAGS